MRIMIKDGLIGVTWLELECGWGGACLEVVLKLDKGICYNKQEFYTSFIF